MRISKSCGHPIIGMGGCCIRCGTRRYKSRISLRRVQVQVLDNVIAQLQASIEPETVKDYSLLERVARGEQLIGKRVSIDLETIHPFNEGGNMT